MTFLDDSHPFARILGWDESTDDLMPVALDFDFVNPIDTDELMTGVRVGMTRMQARQLGELLLTMADAVRLD